MSDGCAGDGKLCLDIKSCITAACVADAVAGCALHMVLVIPVLQGSFIDGSQRANVWWAELSAAVFRKQSLQTP